MSLKTLLWQGVHRLALTGEWVIAKVFRKSGKAGVIDTYVGYATPSEMILRGRVLSKLRAPIPRAGQSRFKNFRQTLSFFLTDEVPGVEVRHDTQTATTDEEGYFTLPLPKAGSGWATIPVSVVGTDVSAECPVLVPSTKARFLVISDIDDTVLETGAYQLWRNLWTSLTGNSLTRHVFQDAIALMNHLSEKGRNPIFYVSSSPWNFHRFLQEIFQRNDLVRGPMFLRDLGLSETKFITGTHGDHKSEAIETVLSANPDLPAILMGDTGQHDAEVYLDVIKRFPGRVAAVVLREPGPGPNKTARDAMVQIEETGTPLLHGPTFEGLAPDKYIAP